MWFIPSLTLPILEIEVHGLNYLNCIFNGAIFYAAAVIRELSKTDICDFIIQVLAFFKVADNLHSLCHQLFEWDISPLLGSIFIFPFRNRYTGLKRATRCKRCKEAFFCRLQCGTHLQNQGNVSPGCEIEPNSSTI